MAQVHFYRKEEPQANAETMETLVQKTSTAERTHTGTTASSHVQYSSMPNANAPTPAPQVILSQPAPITKAAKPVRDNAQFVSDVVSLKIKYFETRKIFKKYW